MELTNIESFSKLLQMSMMPGVLISGVGLLLLSITNRLGRTIDRSRGLAQELESANAQFKEAAKDQLRILLARCRLLRTSVSLAGASILFSSLMIVGLFLYIFLHLSVENLILVFFFFSVLCLIFSMLYFLRDVSLALKAVKLDIKPHLI